MTRKTYLGGLLCTASVLALTPAALAQTDTATETVVVTGSRVISDAANSPTPLTIVTVAALQATTPSDIPDAMNKLPIFSGSTTPRGTNNASQNASGNVLNLRNFGAQRTLILIDGHRVAPSNANGTVDIDATPQMLMSRVDVVTGGASAVYGSDAVTGVVNFILDKHFTGFKVAANSGISNYADAMSYNLGAAAGLDLFGGRGHWEGSVRRFYQDGVLGNNRKQGDQDWLLTGGGSAAAPYTSTINARLTRYNLITCTGCAANGMTFLSNTQIGPNYPGIPTGTNGVTSGGGGGAVPSFLTQVTSTLATSEAFNRFSYQIDDSTSVYIQGNAAESYTKGNFYNHSIESGNVPNTFYKSNPFLSAAVQPALAGTTSTFQFSEYLNFGFPRSGYQSNGLQRNLNLTVGADGSLMGKYDWSVYYTHASSRLDENDPTNTNQQKQFAAEDAVLNASGNVVCNVSTTAFASLYPGCVPMNPFANPGTEALSMNAYYSQDTQWILTNGLDDVGGSISGELFTLPAGPVKAALSGEMRWASLMVRSNASPTATVDCTGLRLCNSTVPLFQNNVVANMPEADNNVWEFAAETDIPLLKDVPLIQSLDANIAGRYTDYSTSGAAQTWKVGLDYHVNDSVRFRATTSVDIRAPNLNDLFAPVRLGAQAYTDIHTGNTTGQNLAQTQGNSALVPEVARTYTAGMVLTPSFIPGFTLSADYYTITLKNALSSISGGNTAVQTICENSAGTSPFCALAVRPFPFANHTSANYPTVIITEQLNTAYNKLEGFDFEANYGFEASSLMDALPGSVSLRLLANYQPVNQSLQYVGAPLTFQALSHGRTTGFVAYKLGNWTFNLQNRWYSGFRKNTQFGQFYADPRVGSRDYVDINIDKKFMIDEQAVDGFLSIQNIANVQPPVNPTNATNPGLYYMGVQGTSTATYDAIGRYFTVGVRANL